VLARPMSYSVLTALFLGIGLMLTLLLATCEYSRKVAVAGVLTPSGGLIKIIAAQPGIIRERAVKEGQTIEAGSVIYRLSSERLNATQGSAEQTISALLMTRRDSLIAERSQLRLQSQARLDSSRRRVDDLAIEIHRVDDEILMQQRKVELAQATLKRYVELAASGYVSPVQAQDKQAEALDQQQRLAELQRARGASSRDQATAQAEVRDLTMQSVRDEQAVDRSIAAAEQDLAENEVRRETVIRSPSAGVVTAITGEVGQAVGSTQILAIVLPQEAELEAELFAPSRAIGFLRAGMPVLLRYQAYPYQKFGQARGAVRDVSRTPLGSADVASAGLTLSGEPLYRVRVRLERQTVRAYGREQLLRSGALLEASIIVDKRYLYEWVLEPLYTISGRLFHDV